MPSKLHPHTAIDHSSVNRRPAIDGPPAIAGAARAEHRVPMALPHVRQVLAVNEQPETANATFNQQTNDDV